MNPQSKQRPPEEDANRVPDAEPYRTLGPRASAVEGVASSTTPPRERADSSPGDWADVTPPLDARTDPGRGTGEFGAEGSDGSKPLRSGEDQLKS
ncbi:MAG TPA: hypothetical protein VFI31_18095 [Pirellulales bacterium]|nr:hypothetical protein [Pirellulales bacterium]